MLSSPSNLLPFFPPVPKSALTLLLLASSIIISTTFISGVDAGTVYPSTSDTYTITHTSNCPYEVYFGAWGQATYPLTAENTGSGPVNQNGKWVQTVPTLWTGGRVWARTGCTGDGTSLTCDIGQCAGGEQCTGNCIGDPDPTSQWGSQTFNITLVEFGFGDNNAAGTSSGGYKINYDISRVQGWNVGVELKSSDGTTLSCGEESCTTDEAFLHETVDDAECAEACRQSEPGVNFEVTWCPNGH